MIWRAERPLTGRDVLWLLLGFFALIIVVNGIFVVLALNSFSGVSTENAYRQGLAYNQTLQAAARQKALGWSARLMAEPRISGGEAALTVRLADADGGPLDGLAVTGEMRRPAHDRADIALRFEALGKGQYRARVHPAEAGQWDLSVLATGAAETRFRWEKRLWLE
ncbi:MAG: FixH family protein [Alphaproteobacteria bacterium]|jgi:nitrogen fixation protein FixH|nr:FixH family protein [Alphaproteobacteria bacterium]MDP6814113.1 FixH family protein [Alphaproteobacteria bacterium]